MKTVNNISLNAIVAKHSAFADFNDLLNARGNYRPTISLHGVRSPVKDREMWNKELRFLADQYDAAQSARDDDRRTYRAGVEWDT